MIRRNNMPFLIGNNDRALICEKIRDSGIYYVYDIYQPNVWNIRQFFYEEMQKRRERTACSKNKYTNISIDILV